MSIYNFLMYTLLWSRSILDKINKKELSEIDICDLFITPAIKDAGWDHMQQIRREVTLTPGPIIVRGNMSSRNKKKFADYVLYQEPGAPIAVVKPKTIIIPSSTACSRLLRRRNP